MTHGRPTHTSCPSPPHPAGHHSSEPAAGGSTQPHGVAGGVRAVKDAVVAGVEHVLGDAAHSAGLPEAQALHELQQQEHLASHQLPADYAKELK
jgi:hypothetical protein